MTLDDQFAPQDFMDQLPEQYQEFERECMHEQEPSWPYPTPAGSQTSAMAKSQAMPSQCQTAEHKEQHEETTYPTQMSGKLSLTQELENIVDEERPPGESNQNPVDQQDGPLPNPTSPHDDEHSVWIPVGFHRELTKEYSKTIHS